MSTTENVKPSVGEKDEVSKIGNEVNGLRSANGVGTGEVNASDPVASGTSATNPDYPVFMSPQAMPFQHFPFTAGVDGTWPGAATQYDPSLLAALQYNVLQTPFYFPGAADIWGQDAAVSNPALMYPLLSPISMDQQQQVSTTEVPTESQTATATAQTAPTAVLDPASLAPSFSGLMLNGGVPGVMAVGPNNVMPTVTDSPPENVGTPSSVGTTGPVQNTAPQPEKPKSWAAIASQPAKPRPPPPKPAPQPEPQVTEPTPSQRKAQPRNQSSQAKSSTVTAAQATGSKNGVRKTQQSQQASLGSTARTAPKGHQSELVGKLLSENKYNPSDFTLSMTNARFFVIKSYAEDDIHRSIKYSIWTSTEHGNRRLDQAYREQKGKGNVYLLFSVNGSGHFCGVAQMMSEVDTNTSTGVWAQDKWKGRFDVKWIYVKDVPNSQLRHIRLENNENKPVTNSRDTQEVPLPKAKQVMKIIHSYQHTTSIFDDFDHYEKKQEEESGKVNLS